MTLAHILVHRVLPLVVCVAALWAPSLAFADEAAVRTSDGGFVRGELIELVPGHHVRVRMIDGTVREIAWSEITDIEQLPSGGAAPAQAQTQLPPPPPLSPATQRELTKLLAEREAIDNTGPAFMMVGGGAAVLLVGLPGVVVLIAASYCDTDDFASSGDPDCDTATSVGTVMSLVGLVGGVVGVWGLIKRIDNDKQTEQLDLRIQQLQLSAATTLDVVPQASGATLVWRGRF